MDAFLNSFFADPLQYIGLVFAFMASVGALLFGAGFFAGVPHLFTISGNEEHILHHRVRSTWGVMIMLYTFILWEIVRVVASWFGYPAPQESGFFVGFLIVLLILLIISWAFLAIKGSVVGND
jgi:hypothetical protein